MEHALVYIIVALGLSTVVNLFFKHYGISQIIGYILTGIAIAYAFDLRHLSGSQELEDIAEFGIVFLMFTIGLEMSIEKMKSMQKMIFLNGTLQVGLSSLFIYLGSVYIFGLGVKTALIVALAFSLSSTAVVLTYLKSSKEIYTPYGKRSTAILIFQDIAVIPILILIGILTNESHETLSTILTHTAISAVIVLAFLFIAGKQVITWLLHFSASSEVDELFMGSVLFILFGASLWAHYMGFTYSLGAFIAGVLIAETRYHHKVEADIAPFKDILLGTFFIVVGMKIDAQLFIDNVLLIVGLFLLVLLLKTLITFVVIKISSNSSTSLKTALSIAQIGEFSFVIFSIASIEGIIDDKLSQLLVLVVILSMVVTPFFISKVKAIAGFFIKDKLYVPEVIDLKQRKNHIIVAGYGVVGKFVTQNLEIYGAEYVIVDNNPKHVKRALDEGYEAYLGDMSKKSILDALHVENSSSVIVTLDNIDKERLICEAILHHTKDVNLGVKIVSLEERDMLKDLDIDVVVDGKVEVARVIVERMMSCQLSKKGIR